VESSRVRREKSARRKRALIKGDVDGMVHTASVEKPMVRKGTMIEKKTKGKGRRDETSRRRKSIVLKVAEQEY